MKSPEQSGNHDNLQINITTMKALFLTLFVSIGSVFAADQIPNPLIDYKGFQIIVADSSAALDGP